ncbi:hypothetical protein AB0I28_30005 [Phytomonospora sp. NPDC050363]|uniref:hypothetical protein n=1 Tax=Phytomonospora sp. NPDC050363 TaxID=3155642 RepID=UPI0033C9B7B7
MPSPATTPAAARFQSRRRTAVHHTHAVQSSRTPKQASVRISTGTADPAGATVDSDR